MINQLEGFLVLWIIAGFVLLFMLQRRSNESVGLPLAYFMGLFLIHVPGAAIYLVPGYQYYSPRIVQDGFTMTTYGMLAFVAGIIVMARLRIKQDKVGPRELRAATEVPQASARYMNKLARNCVVIGLFVSLVLLPLLAGAATVTSLLSGITGLTVVGICLGLRAALVHNKILKLRMWMLASLSLPIITLVTSAFVGYGMNSLVVIISFLVMSTRTGPLRILMLIVAAYLGLSFFVTYMRDRTDIRNAFWLENAQYTERFDMIGALFTNFEFFDVDKRPHLVAIDDRLNQNWLVGTSIGFVGKQVEYANGETILFSFVGLVPRVIWPDKPDVGGGGGLVSKYTGVRFNKYTSVGAGQVLEFYVNFGTSGVVIGFFVLGLLIKYFDTRGFRALVQQDYRGFIVWMLAGIGFLQAGGNFVEVTTSVVAGIAGGIGITSLLRQPIHMHRRPTELQPA